MVKGFTGGDSFLFFFFWGGSLGAGDKGSEVLFPNLFFLTVQSSEFDSEVGTWS